MRIPTVAATISLSTVLVLAVPVAGQQLTGVVLDQETDQGIEGAELVARDTAGVVHGRSVSDENGGFMIPLEQGGTFTLAVSRIGYQPLSSVEVTVAEGERLVLEIRLGVQAVPLDPVVVSSRSRLRSPIIELFYERLEQGRRSGTGHFFARSDIEDLQPNRATDLLRTVSGVQVVRARGAGGGGGVVRMRGGCTPALYIDGTHINRFDRNDSLDSYLSPQSIEGVEVYRGAGGATARFYDPSGCGMVLVWTRGGEANSGNSLPWRTLLAVVGGALALMFAIN